MWHKAHFWPTLAILTLSFFVLDSAICHYWKRRLVTPRAISDPVTDISAIADREEFFARCGGALDDEKKFEACREKLPVLSTSFIWVDTRYLLKKGESLSANHLDVFYGLSGAGAESARMTIGSALVTRCRKGTPTKAANFEELIDPKCFRRLPTLAEMGMELDPKWAGAQMVESKYDGRMKWLPK